MLSCLRDANLHVNAAKSFVAESKIAYLGHILIREGIKPQLEKVSDKLAINPPNTVKELTSS